MGETRDPTKGARAQLWSNGPDVVYEWHSHSYDKLLECVGGSITFHTSAGDHSLTPGEQLYLAAGTDHAATVGPQGVTCREYHLS